MGSLIDLDQKINILDTFDKDNKYIRQRVHHTGCGDGENPYFNWVALLSSVFTQGKVIQFLPTYAFANSTAIWVYLGVG